MKASALAGVSRRESTVTTRRDRAARPAPDLVDRKFVADKPNTRFGKRCREAGVRPSMGSVGDCYDNAMCESFFATLECEMIDPTSFCNHDHARDATFDFIEGFYNTHRRHSALGDHSPVQFETGSGGPWPDPKH
jgi:transposase InsO family protein